MSETKQVTLSAQDINSTAKKLEQFGQGLSPNEQVVVGWLMERAAIAPPTEHGAEVTGYLFPNGGVPQAGLVGAPFNRALGLTPGGLRPAQDLISVSVTVEF